MEIKNIRFEGHYVKQVSEKTQIVMHHTVGGGTAQDVANYWKSLKNKIGTSFIIEKDGTIAQLFDTKYGAGHVGDCTKSFKKFKLPIRNCSMNSVGIELISMGGLKKIGNDLINAYGGKFKGNYYELNEPFRGYKYYEKYTDEQINALKVLLISISQQHSIPIKYNEDIWDVTPRALTGEHGLFSHTSFRLDKSDLYPYDKLVDMLKEL